MTQRLTDSVPFILAVATLAATAAFAPPARAQAAGPVASIELGIGSALAASRPKELRADEWATVTRLYRRERSATPSPHWIEVDRLAPRANALLAVLAAVDTLGLQPEDYPIGALSDAVRAVTSSPEGAGRASALARADVLLTASFVALVDDLLTGRVDPRKVEPSWHIAPRVFDVAGRIEAALSDVRAGRDMSEVLAGVRPDYGVYFPLLQGLARYRALERAGGWPTLPDGPTMRSGDVTPRVRILRRRLAAEGYQSDRDGGDTLDVSLAGVVAEFQRRHGLVIDSIVGPGTRRALDVSASRRARQIEANIERLRWLPPNPGERFIVVNVPSFRLVAYDGDARTLTMRVVVGDELRSRRTPIFADTMEYIEFGPYWNVPRSIAVNEILPRARRDRGYLARNRYQILRGWGDDAPVVDPYSLSDAALFSSRYRVRQLPGPRNALGRVKFMFPNDYAVYLHDTPAQSGFDDVHRAHSHGCVRVADPEALAAFVLQDRSDWPRERIVETLNAGRRMRVNLRNGPPVYLIYLTAFVRDGEVMFRDDIYDRDAGLLRALATETTSSR